MTIFLILYFFLLGLILGSFFNVVGLRLPKGEMFKEKRSYCPHCQNSLKWYELIPVLSFLVQLGHCRHCHKQISPIYPIMEFISGCMFAFCFWYFGFTGQLLLALLLISLFHMITVSDLAYMIIPDRLLVIFFGLFFLFRLVNPLEPWWVSLIGGGIGVLCPAVVILVSRGGMGGGDMKLFGVLGFALGWKLLLVTFFLSILIGATLCILLLSTGLLTRKKPIPFGPFIVVGASLAFFSGRVMIEWYMGTFF